MKQLFSLVLVSALLLIPAAFAESAPLTGTGDGFGGQILATVTLDGDKIVGLELKGDGETQGIGAAALEPLTAAILEKGSVEGVDGVSGATWTSKGVFYAVNNAIDPAAYPYPVAAAAAEAATVEAADAYMGQGYSSIGRIGPGKDDKDTQVYSFNQVFANALFDGDGRILNLDVDVLEVATPNYDGEGMPHFAGFPGQSYNYDENHDEKVDGTLTYDDDSFQAEIAGWQTKRARGDSYKLNSGTWAQEMDAFERLFTGMTVDEVEAWFNRYCSDLNGRPLNITDKSKEEDIAKYNALSDEDKAVLADVVSSATMSLKDAHSDILAAIRDAYDKRQPLPAGALSGYGFGLATSGRVGPGKDDTDTQVYSINEVMATLAFDENDRIASIYVDMMEVATPNYDGEGMPHFAGFPGQSYNYDENHDEKVDGQLSWTDDDYLAAIAGWQTKRERGDGYKLNSGTWTQEMDAFQRLFTGMTVDEAEAWFDKYCSDLNGRPLNITEKSKDEDIAKYNALSDEEKGQLADVVSSATMSLKDAHGDILAAIRNALTNKIDVTLTVAGAPAC